MAKVTFYRLLDKSGVPERTNNEIITAANLKPGYEILSSNQSFELAEDSNDQPIGPSSSEDSQENNS